MKISLLLYKTKKTALKNEALIALRPERPLFFNLYVKKYIFNLFNFIDLNHRDEKKCFKYHANGSFIPKIW